MLLSKRALLVLARLHMHVLAADAGMGSIGTHMHVMSTPDLVHEVLLPPPGGGMCTDGVLPPLGLCMRCCIEQASRKNGEARRSEQMTGPLFAQERLDDLIDTMNVCGQHALV